MSLFSIVGKESMESGESMVGLELHFSMLLEILAWCEMICIAKSIIITILKKLHWKEGFVEFG